MRGASLTGRVRERQVVDGLLAGMADGGCGALIIRGGPGIGKTALLEYARDAAQDVRLLWANGVESEAELPFAGLHQLLQPVMHRLKELPRTQAAALRGAMGLGPATGDRFLVGLAVLTLLAGSGPVLCLIDDAQWLDRSSADALVFASRRLTAGGVVLLFAARDDWSALAGLDELRLTGLEPAAAEALLRERAPGLAPQLRERIMNEALGNPLALIEFAKTAGAADPQGLGAPQAPLPVTRKLHETFHRQVDALPEAVRRLLLLAAADDTGDLELVLRAAELADGQAGAERALESAETAGLIRIDGGLLTFRHPLVRSAVYQGAPFTRRCAAHRALADVLLTYGEGADRRVWHLALAATRSDDAIGAALEGVAHRAGGRSGYATAAAAYERAAHLTADRRQRGLRLSYAAEAAVQSGQLGQARDLARRAEPLTHDPARLAGLARVRAAVEFELGFPSDAGEVLVKSAESIERTDPERAALMLAHSIRTFSFSGDAGRAHDAAQRLSLIDVPPGSGLTPLVRAMRAMADLLAGRGGVGSPIHELIAAAHHVPAHRPAERLLAASLALITAQDTIALELAEPVAEHARTHGMVGMLPHALEIITEAQLLGGRHLDALTSATEGYDLGRDTGQLHRLAHLGGLLAWLTAISGDHERCRMLAEAGIRYGNDHGVVPAGALSTWALGLLELGMGRAAHAVGHLESTRHPIVAVWCAADLIEAGVRANRTEVAERSLRTLMEWDRTVRRPWVSAMALRCRAMTTSGGDAGQHFEAAIELHERCAQPYQHARTCLAYGEWLRRRRSRARAGIQLRTALRIFEDLGARPWADRARAELDAAGEPRPGHGTDAASPHRLTPQELQVVRLAAAGLSNRDIARQLFLSPKTVAQHLYKAYPKLGITSRTQLDHLDFGTPAATGRP
ncbi:helix-turn-helix transcriptional regulator [Nonomuraea jabiensis]|uniref:DNA-binding CsgD family transcriptional regulator n=1 Tax=Nonomuraea jabiensis TaxID=882448 RepID=A0A7W9GCB0_9ACTN|nr:LuxR family transcriptional regulator [Nonomuraea jabiensis]MBB5781134.1 DNA-binding CsgD family transcriptional regulator [Nonomuraea jabiensis]